MTQALHGQGPTPAPVGGASSTVAGLLEKSSGCWSGHCSDVCDTPRPCSWSHQDELAVLCSHCSQPRVGERADNQGATGQGRICPQKKPEEALQAREAEYYRGGRGMEQK